MHFQFRMRVVAVPTTVPVVAWVNRELVEKYLQGRVHAAFELSNNVIVHCRHVIASGTPGKTFRKHVLMVTGAEYKMNI